jgi:hypothetical protein
VGTVAAVSLATWVWWLGDPSPSQRSRGANALWAAHTWVGDRHTDAEYREFARLLREGEISDVFFHAGPFEADGSVRPDRVRHAADLLRAMGDLAPGARPQAYLGQVERRGGGPLDLRDAAVRRRVVATAGEFLDMGFGGIHYDIEPIYPGDGEFLELLAETRRLTRARGAVLSVAVEQLEVVPGAQRALGGLGYHHPTRGWLRAVAARVDQVAVMTYDTALPADWLFGAHMAWQTQQVVEAIGGDVTVFMGVPTYGKGRFPGYYGWAETVRSGVRGVRKGLDRLPARRTGRVGIALFTEWTTTPDEWRAYREAWVGEG